MPSATTSTHSRKSSASSSQTTPIKPRFGNFAKGVPIVGVSPPSEYDGSLDDNMHIMGPQDSGASTGTLTMNGHGNNYESQWLASRHAANGARGSEHSSNNGHDDFPSQAPSLTTGSTSPSIDSLESIQDMHVRSQMHKGSIIKSTLTRRAGSQQPPTSFDSSQDGTRLVHSEYGYCANQDYRHVSEHRKGSSLPSPIEEEPSYFIVLTTYFSYLILIVFGHMRDFFGKRLFPKAYRHLMEGNGYAALNSDFDSFYTRRLKARLDDCFSRPVTGVCGRTVMMLDRTSDDYYQSFRFTGEKTRALNISAYNYLGFAQSHGGCADAVFESLKRYGVSSFGSRLGAGSLDLQSQAEKLVSRFVGCEDSIVVSMGFATNSSTIPAVAAPGTLIISDEFNHTSIRFGARMSGAHIRQYKHNDMRQLENLLRECISQGMPRTHRPWKKILLIVEGLYSMEGTLVNLPELIRLKEKYKFFLYVDEAHSIGAIGPRGRGVCDYFGIDPKRVDILMGTFTKSFGAAGGYIAGSKALIDRIRLTNHSNVYGETLSPPVLTQVITSMASIMGVGNSEEENALVPSWVDLPPRLSDGSEGRERLRRLAFNARYLSSGLRKLGFIIYGHRDSPIVPLLIFHPAKMPLFSRLMLDRQLSLPPSERWARDASEMKEEETRALSDPVYAASLDRSSRPPIVVVVVAYPATPLISSRVRFCVSAAHTVEDMQNVLRATDEIGTLLGMKYGSGGAGGTWNIDEVVARPVDLVKWDGESPLEPRKA